MRVVVVSPHRDDAAFSLGLAIEHWLGKRNRVDVLNCFTQSQYAPYSDVENLHSNDRRSFASALRSREDVAWNKLMGGRLQITSLDLLDAPLRLSCSVDEAMKAEIRPGDRALSRVAGSLRKIAGKGEFGSTAMLAPLAVGGHIDHRLVRQATLEALAGNGLPLAFYEDLPYAARPGGEGEIEALVAAANLGLEPVFLQPTAVDPAVSRARKHRLAECYDSQIDNIVAEQIAAFCERYAGRERVWANPAFAACALAMIGSEPLA